MRYSVEHKEQSRKKILEAGRELFRQHGFEGASIDQVMNAASLTRGAFYAHFDSKEDLVGQVLSIEAGLVTALSRAAAAEEPRTSAMTALADYLDPRQRVNNATGCPLVAHPVDAIRGSPGLRSGYTDQLKALIDGLQAALGDDGMRDDAVLVAVLTVGAGLLSAASDDDDLADSIEKVCLNHVRTVVEPSARG